LEEFNKSNYKVFFIDAMIAESSIIVPSFAVYSSLREFVLFNLSSFALFLPSTSTCSCWSFSEKVTQVLC